MNTSIAAPSSEANTKTDQKLIVVIIDGCRWDYFSRDEPNHHGFQKFKTQGVVAKYVQPIYPSSSFESWTTINTGLYPESHQITRNHMYDKANDEFFTLDDDTTTNDPKWWKGNHIPIWTSLTHQGFNVGLFHWSKCQIEFEIDGQVVKPKICLPYDDKNGHEDSTSTLSDELDNYYKKIIDGELDVAFVYTPHIDNQGHAYGPDSIEVENAMNKVDQILDGLLEKIKSDNKTNIVNMIVVADHGMVDNSKLVHKKLSANVAKEALDEIKYIVDRGDIAVKNPSKIDMVVDELKKWTDMKVFKKEDIPDYYRTKNGKYTLDIMMVPNGNVTLSRDNDFSQYFPENKGDESEESQSKGGDHG